MKDSCLCLMTDPPEPMSAENESTPRYFLFLLTCKAYLTVRGLAQFVPIARFSAKEHRARVDGRATARHPHGIIERTVRCHTVKVSAESAGAVASTMFLESLPT